jgi:hypothetical protein
MAGELGNDKLFTREGAESSELREKRNRPLSGRKRAASGESVGYLLAMYFTRSTQRLL